jgi:sugar lactone lactonase YvrE
MTETEKVRRYKLTGLLLLIIFSGNLVSGQQNASYEVCWVGQCPSGHEDNRKKIGEKISEVVFGRKPSEVVKPFGVIAISKDHLLMADQGRGTIFECVDGNLDEMKGITKDTPPFPSLVGMTRLPGGTLLFTDSRLNGIFSMDDQRFTSFSDNLSLVQPTGIAFSKKTQEVWVVETGAHRIAILNGEGKVLKHIGERGSSEGAFNYPTFIWIDDSGKVYIVDSMNFRIQVLDPQGNFLYAFGENGDATGTMARPKGVATDSRGNIYVADALFHVVQIFDATGNFLYSFGRQGQGKGEFWMPAGIYIDAHDFIYVADSYNARIQIFQLEKK